MENKDKDTNWLEDTEPTKTKRPKDLLVGKEIQSLAMGEDYARLQFTDGSSLTIRAKMVWEADDGSYAVLEKKLAYTQEVEL